MHVLQHLEVLHLRRAQEDEGVSLPPDARRPPHAVDVVRRLARGVVLHDPTHILQVQATRGHILYINNTYVITGFTSVLL